MIFLLFLSGIGIGFVLRSKPMPMLSHLISSIVVILLFLLGVEAGNNREVMESFPQLGAEAFAIAMGGVVGSCSIARLVELVFKHVKRRKTTQ